MSRIPCTSARMSTPVTAMGKSPTSLPTEYRPPMVSGKVRNV